MNEKPSRLKVHWILLRPFATAGLIPPMLLGYVMAGANDLITFLLAFIGATLILYGTHYHNSYSDYVRGIDRGVTAKAYTSASAVLPRGWVSVNEVIAGTFILYFLGVLVWVYLAVSKTPLAIIPMLIGLGCGILYNEHGKYKGYGELLLALAFGLASTLAGYIPVAGKISIEPVLVALIPGILWSLFYTMDQYQDKDEDAKLGLRNIAITLSDNKFPISRYIEFGFFLVLVIHLFLILVGIIPPLSFISIAVSPLMFLAVLSADVNPRKSAIYLILTFGFYVLLMDLGIVFGGGYS